MATTTGATVIEFFESVFADKHILPESLERMWLRKAIARYTLELNPLNYDVDTDTFTDDLSDYVIESLARIMYQYYQEREVSLVNKTVSIVGKDLSIDGANGRKNAERYHLEHVKKEAQEFIEHQKPPAYN